MQEVLLVHYTIFKFCELGIVPSVGRAYEIARDTLYVVDIVAVTLGTLGEIFLSILVAAIHATVTVVIDRAIADVILIHEINDITDSLGVVGSIAVNLHIEYVTASSEFVIGSLDLSLVARGALVVDGDVIGVGIINFVGHTGYDAKRATVTRSEFARKALGRSRKDGEVVLITPEKSLTRERMWEIIRSPSFCESSLSP